MFLQTQSLMTHLLPRPSLCVSKPIAKYHYDPPNPNRLCKSSFGTLKCSLSAVSEPTYLELVNNKPFPAEVSRTITELSSVGTLSAPTQEGWPLGIGVRFVVDPHGTPVLCFNASNLHFSADNRSSLHVQLEQCSLRTPQCTILGNLHKPEDKAVFKRLNSVWEKRFGEEVNEDLMHVIAVERVLLIEDFKEDGIWVTSSDYKNASPDPLRDFAEKIVDEINTNNVEDVYRFCNIYVDLNFQVTEAKMIWVDRLGFDMRLCSPQNDIYEVRIPFPQEVTDEKGAKSSFNCMSQLAWEVEKNYHASDFKKVKQLKQVTCRQQIR